MSHNAASVDLITVPDVAAMLGVTSGAVYRWIRDKKLPAMQFGGKKGSYRIRREDYEAFVKKADVRSEETRAAA